jgi:DNA adenine methylase
MNCESHSTLSLPKNPFGVMTPLRYPGGKSSISGFLADIISYTGSETYVEPYAGGAGAAISLLLNGKVKNIVINDYDRAVYSFWKEIVSHPERFIKKVEDAVLSVDEWSYQKSIYKDSSASQEDLGFAFFYLNRTNRSGILTAGLIGGKAQQGKYKIDARFNKKVLIDKIQGIVRKREQIKILNEDGINVYERFRYNSKCIVYLDPPYVQQGKNLYLNAFETENHKVLANTLQANENVNWLLTYDEDALIKKLYRKSSILTYEMRYRVQSNRVGNELMIYPKSLNDFFDCYKLDRCHS